MKHTPKLHHEDIEFIVKAVTSHEALVEALRGLMVHLEFRDDYVVEDAEKHGNCYSKAVEALTQAGEI